MAKHGKGYRKAAELVDGDHLYSPLQAAGLAKQTSTTSYDATVEVAMRLGVDPRKACLLYTSPSPRDGATSRMPSSA